MSQQEQVVVRYVLQARIDANGAAGESLRAHLDRSFEGAISDGAITGHSEAEVDEYSGEAMLISPAADSIDEEQLATWISQQLESGAWSLEDIPKLMARYALADPGKNREELAERMGLEADAQGDLWIAISTDGYWSNSLGWVFDASSASPVPDPKFFEGMISQGLSVIKVQGEGAYRENLPSLGTRLDWLPSIEVLESFVELHMELGSEDPMRLQMAFTGHLASIGLKLEPIGAAGDFSELMVKKVLADHEKAKQVPRHRG